MKYNTPSTYSAILTTISSCLSLSDLPNEQLSNIKQNHPHSLSAKNTLRITTLKKGSKGDDTQFSVSRCFIQSLVFI